MQTKTTNDTIERGDIYTRVTDAIVRAIEEGAGKYAMPWIVTADKGFSPVSIATVKPYRGINTVVLWSEAQSKGYSSALWGTYKQWAEIGGQVRKGEKASPVCYWGTVKNQDDAEIDETGRRSRLFCKGYAVFNLNQVDNVETLPRKFTPKLSANERIDRAERFFADAGIDVKDGGNRAFYRPGTDTVHMPSFAQFPDRTAYYSTLAHEAGHWTGHESRCKRDFSGRFGSESYAVEELVAELSSAYQMAHLELESTPRKDHAAYIDNWLKVLKGDKRAIFTAASAAQKAADFIISRAGETTVSLPLAA